MSFTLSHPTPTPGPRQLQRSLSIMQERQQSKPTIGGPSSSTGQITGLLDVCDRLSESNPSNVPLFQPVPRLASTLFRDHDSDDEGCNPPLAKYQRLAESVGLPPDHAAKVAQVALMTPRTVRVLNQAHIALLGDIASSLRAAQITAQKNFWEVGQELKNQIKTRARLAMFAPIPYAWKHQHVPVIFKLLKDKKCLPNDIDKHPNWKNKVNTEISQLLSRARSTLKAHLMDEFDLKTKNMHITDDVLAGLAWLRMNMQVEKAAEAMGHNTWDILEVRVWADRATLDSEDAHTLALNDWLTSDQLVHGNIPPDTKIKEDMASLQKHVFEAMQSENHSFEDADEDM